MFVKDNFYVARHGDDAYKAKFVPTASVINYVSHKESIMAYYEMHNYIIKCILNDDEEITLKVTNTIGSKNYRVTNCCFVDYENKGYVYWKDLFVDSFKSFLKRTKKINNCSV